MKETKIEGRVWVLTTPTGELYDDIDTDMIFHNRYLHITAVDQMGQYAFDNLQGWEDFAHKAQPGDIVVAGKNFGAGSSRQQAVDCFPTFGRHAVRYPGWKVAGNILELGLASESADLAVSAWVMVHNPLFDSAVHRRLYLEAASGLASSLDLFYRRDF